MVLIMLTNRSTLKLSQSVKEAYPSVFATVLRERGRTMYFRLPFILLWLPYLPYHKTMTLFGVLPHTVQNSGSGIHKALTLGLTLH